jgi:hypothetical protein
MRAIGESHSGPFATCRVRNRETPMASTSRGGRACGQSKTLEVAVLGEVQCGGLVRLPLNLPNAARQFQARCQRRWWSWRLRRRHEAGYFPWLRRGAKPQQSTPACGAQNEPLNGSKLVGPAARVKKRPKSNSIRLGCGNRGDATPPRRRAIDHAGHADWVPRSA